MIKVLLFITVFLTSKEQIIRPQYFANTKDIDMNKLIKMITLPSKCEIVLSKHYLSIYYVFLTYKFLKTFHCKYYGS